MLQPSRGERPPVSAELAEKLNTPVISIDCQVTRRARCHVVDLPANQGLFASNDLVDCLRMLEDEGYSLALIVNGQESDPKTAFQVRFDWSGIDVDSVLSS
jgi:hypothetical protein